MYKILKFLETGSECIVKEDALTIPADEKNSDYIDYLAWLSEGNEPELVEIEE